MRSAGLLLNREWHKYSVPAWVTGRGTSWLGTGMGSPTRELQNALKNMIFELETNELQLNS
jgi:hypothetical protein